MDIIKIKNLGGIKCDNPNCNYKDESVRSEEYYKWINKPCPICGHNLLTGKDYIAFNKSIDTINKINSFGHKLPKFIQKIISCPERKDTYNLTIDFNGSGKTFVKENKEP